MMDNHVYNLMRQAVEEHTSLWRIRKEYQQDADECEQCQAFWQRMEQDKQNHVNELTQLIKEHLVDNPDS